MTISAGLDQRVIRSSVDWSGTGIALADYLAGRFTYRSRAEWVARITEGEILLNHEKADPETVLQLHDLIEYFPGDLPEPEAILSYETLYEDDRLLAVGKPGNLCTHPAGPFFKHTLWHLLMQKYGRIHLINRLDRETSGIVLAAKDAPAAAAMGRRGAIESKTYLAAVFGRFPDEPMTAAGFLFPDPASLIRKKRRWSAERPQNGEKFESCETQFTLTGTDGHLSAVRAELATGRFHQIRATLCSLGFPLVGDKLYGPDETLYLKIKENALTRADMEKLLLPRQALHAGKLTFRHPADGHSITVTAPLPDDLQKLFSRLSGASGGEQEAPAAT